MAVPCRLGKPTRGAWLVLGIGALDTGRAFVASGTGVHPGLGEAGAHPGLGELGVNPGLGELLG